MGLIKQVILNSRTVPVPIPLSSLSGAIEWVQDTLISSDHLITRVVLDGEDIELDRINVGLTEIGPNSKLEIQVDSPIDLSIQSLDALRNLSTVIEQCLKPLAVNCWQTKPNQKPDDLSNVIEDIDLSSDLLKHVMEIIALDERAANELQAAAKALDDGRKALSMAAANSDWKGCAKILLNKLEGVLDDIIRETSRLQTDLFMLKADSGEPSLRAKKPPL